MDHEHEGEKRYITKMYFKEKIIILKSIGYSIHFDLIMKICIFIFIKSIN